MSMYPSLDVCVGFIEKIPFILQKEFEEKFCEGNFYEYYAETNPDSFVKSAVQYALTENQNIFFQDALKRYFGSVEELSAMVTMTEPVRNKDAAVQNKIEPGQKKKILSQSKEKQPIKSNLVQKSYTNGTQKADKMKESIVFKLYELPQTHDRYTRLTTEEIQYIVQNAGLSKREREVFLLKCGKRYLPYWEIGDKLNVSESTVKKRAIQIDKMIKAFLFGDSFS